MHHLFPYREGWRREAGIGKAAHCDPINACVLVALPKYVAAAVGAEMEPDLESTVRITLINLVVAYDPNLAFRISATGMDDGPGAPLTSPTMTHIHSFRLTRGDHPKRAAMALRRSLHRSLPSRSNAQHRVYRCFIIHQQHRNSSVPGTSRLRRP